MDIGYIFTTFGLFFHKLSITFGLLYLVIFDLGSYLINGILMFSLLTFGLSTFSHTTFYHSKFSLSIFSIKIEKSWPPKAFFSWDLRFSFRTLLSSQVADLKLRTSEKNCDWGIAELRLRSNISLQSCGIAIAEVLPSSCGIAMADSKKVACSHLCCEYDSVLELYELCDAGVGPLPGREAATDEPLLAQAWGYYCFTLLKPT
jgi:hypothetical protein